MGETSGNGCQGQIGTQPPHQSEWIHEVEGGRKRSSGGALAVWISGGTRGDVVTIEWEYFRPHCIFASVSRRAAIS